MLQYLGEQLYHLDEILQHKPTTHWTPGHWSPLPSLSPTGPQATDPPFPPFHRSFISPHEHACSLLTMLTIYHARHSPF